MFHPLARSAARAFASGVALACLAATTAQAQTLLRWIRPSGSPSVDTFRVYKGPATNAGEVVYQDLPVPDAMGVYSAAVQIDEIDQGIPVYVWITAANAFGESGPSNPRFYPEGCDPVLDPDCDGVPSDGAVGDLPCATGQTAGCDDNCPYAPNPTQTDRGGIRAGSSPDGIGDACQCGDVSGDGRVTSADSAIILRSLQNPPTAAMTLPELCNVGGGSSCTSADSAIVLRAQLNPPTATVQQVCAPAFALP